MFPKCAGLCRYNRAFASLHLLLCLLILPVPVIADWNSGVTIEDVSTRIAIDIVDDGVEVSIDLKENAITQFYAKKTTDTSASNELISLDQFALQAIKIQAGDILKARIKSSTKNDNNAAIKVFLPFVKAQPQQLDIIPDFKSIEKAGEKYIITVSHQGLPVIDHGVLTSAESLNLNWQDPWYSQFSNPKLQRGHSDPVMAFLYIEPQQIKSEVVVRIKEIAAWAKLELRDDILIHPDEYAEIKQKVGQYLLAQNKISTGDVATATPILDRVDYIRMGASDIQAYEPQQAQRQVATLIGVSVIHPIPAIPAKIQWHWDLFNEKIQRIAIRAYDPAGLFDSYVTPDYPVFEWENMLADIDLPELDNKPKSIAVVVDSSKQTAQLYVLFGIIAFILFFSLSYKYTPSHIRKYTHTVLLLIALTGVYSLFSKGLLNINSTQLDKAQAKPILKQLIWNVYQAFEATQEEATYDQLAYSVSGDLIESLYLQHRQSFLVQDGAWAKVKNIEIQNLESSTTSDDSYLFDCEWLVTGDVIHWGHQHRRDNLYRANIKISAIDKHWKIIGLESIAQQRVN